jgi:hypothetical protein
MRNIRVFTAYYSFLTASTEIYAISGVAELFEHWQIVSKITRVGNNQVARASYLEIRNSLLLQCEKPKCLILTNCVGALVNLKFKSQFCTPNMSIETVIEKEVTLHTLAEIVKG